MDTDCGSRRPDETGSDILDFTERVADIPMLIEQQQTMGIPEVIDEIFQAPGHRLDSTSGVVHHDPEGSDLFRYGHSKDHRLDLAQFIIGTYLNVSTTSKPPNPLE